MASQYGEWIELYNAGDESVDLDGWALYKADGVKLIDLAGNILPGAYFLVERSTSSSPDPITDISSDILGKFGSSGLRNTGEILELHNSFDKTVDIIDCSGGWFAGDNTTKSSMERISAFISGSDPMNWADNTGLLTTGTDASGNPILGTPKYPNSVQNQ